MNQFLTFYNDECSMQHKELFDRLLSQARAQEVARGAWDARYEERLSREADLIRQHGGIDLLLTLHALCNPAAAPEAITTNAAPSKYELGFCQSALPGSLVCYLLGISNVDPLKYDLSFERFWETTLYVSVHTPTTQAQETPRHASPDREALQVYLNHFFMPVLDVTSMCLAAIEAHHGVAIDLRRLPVEPDVFPCLYTDIETASGKPYHIFQNITPRTMDILTTLRPDSIEDLILSDALDQSQIAGLPERVACAKHSGHWEASALNEMPEVHDILRPTYGFLIYQEQLLQILHRLAGHPPREAMRTWDYLAHKRTTIPDEERLAFLYGDVSRGIPGCSGNGIPLEKALRAFTYLQEIAPHTICKSHAAANGMLSYQMAWLKCHYPAELSAAIEEVYRKLDLS